MDNVILNLANKYTLTLRRAITVATLLKDSTARCMRELVGIPHKDTFV